MTQDNTLTFGKYKNQNISDVAKFDFSYLTWLSDNAFDIEFKQTLKLFVDSYKVDKSEQCKIVDNIFTFGKFRGKNFKTVYRENPRYFNWVLRTFPEDKVLVDGINLFLSEMKPIQKRLNRIVKYINAQKLEAEHVIKLNEYLVKKEKRDMLYSDILCLNLNDFYIVNGRNKRTFCKIINITLCDDNDAIQVLGDIKTEVEYYYFDVIGGMVLSTKHYNNTTIALTTLPIKYNFDYNIYFMVERDVYNYNFINIKETPEKDFLKVSTCTERIMSDVWDSVSYTYFKDVLLSVSGDFRSDSGKNSISIEDKFIVCDIKKVDMSMFMRFMKLTKIKSKINQEKIN